MEHMDEAFRVMDRMIELALNKLEGQKITNELLQRAMDESFLLCENNPFKNREELTKAHKASLDIMENEIRKRLEER